MSHVIVSGEFLQKKKGAEGVRIPARESDLSGKRTEHSFYASITVPLFRELIRKGSALFFMRRLVIP